MHSEDRERAYFSDNYADWNGGAPRRGIGMFIGGMLFGMGVMYMLDPGRGGNRRNYLVGKLTRAARMGGMFADKRSRDIANRARGAWEEREARARDEANPPDDQTLEERVRAQIGHVVRHTGVLDVIASGGRVIVRGYCLPGESAKLEERLAETRGVEDFTLEVEEVANPGERANARFGERRSA